jgi:MFS transporter, DHA1 family, solute carrier family 18 (vesicular amine transporter), member 1/2
MSSSHPPGAPARRSAAVTVAAVALATDMFVYGVAVPVLPRIAAAHGASAAEVGVLFAVYAGALLVTTPVAGVLVDRVGNRVPMLAGLLVLAAAVLLFAFAQAYPTLVLARLLQGCAAAVSWTAGLGLIAAAYPAEEVGKPMGVALSSMGAGVLLGPLAGGLLAGHLGTRAPFLLAAAVAAADGVVRMTLIRDEPAPRRDTPARVWRHPAMPGLFGLTALGAGLVAFLEPVLPLHTATRFRATPGAIGLLFAVALLVGMVVAPVAGALADRLPRGRLAGAGALCAALALVVVSRAPSLWVAGAGLALAAAAAQLVLTPTLTLIAEVAGSQDPPAYGAAYAAYNVAYTTGLVVAPLLAGGGSSAVGFGRTTLAGAVLAALLGVAVTAARGLAARPGSAPPHAGAPTSHDAT